MYFSDDEIATKKRLQLRLKHISQKRTLISWGIIIFILALMITNEYSYRKRLGHLEECLANNEKRKGNLIFTFQRDCESFLKP